MAKRRKGAPTSAKERVAAAAAPLHDRRRRLVGAREATLRDLGGLMLEMYKRNRFREELLLDKCEEVLAVEVEIAHVDQRLFQLAPPNAAGMRPIGRCDCGAPIHPGQNFCGKCGRSFTTLTQSRSCIRCGSGLRSGDQFCSTCGSEAPDMLQALEAAPTDPNSGVPTLDGAAAASSAVADTVIIEAPSLDDTKPDPAATAPTASPADLEPPVPDIAPAPAPTPGDTTPAPASSTPEDVLDVPAVPERAPATGTETTAGFDWSATPASPESAIDAALAAMPENPTDAGTPYAGFPLSATVPPPPVVDQADITPTAVDQPPVIATTPADPGIVADAPPNPDPAPTPATAPSPREQAKRAAAEKKAKAKAAKARAKARAKAARAGRKRGDDS